MPEYNNELDQQAKAYFSQGDFVQAASLYKQLYDQSPNTAFYANHYIRSLRKLNKSSVAVEFGRLLSKKVLDNAYVHTSLGWAIYDTYFKKHSQNNQEENTETIPSSPNEVDFAHLQKRAAYILSHKEVDNLLRKKIVFALCAQAKHRQKWQIMYNFASQLDPEKLSTQEEDFNGRKSRSEHQRWLEAMTRSLLELEQYEECQTFTQKGCELYPKEKLFPWWEAIRKQKQGKIEEALTDLLRINTRFAEEWYIQRDIAQIYELTQRLEEAWLWYCKAAALPGDKIMRYKMLISMAQYLEHHDRLQEAYEHLNLAYFYCLQEQWEAAANNLKGQIDHFVQQHSFHLTQLEIEPKDYATLEHKCLRLWQSTISASRPQRVGTIKMFNQEKGFGFIQAEDGDTHFQVRNFQRRVTPQVGMRVQFEIESSYDRSKQRESTKAVNIKPIR
ncbi:cold-shock protein [Ktedonospora formicarum]|uniref:CSD domain-containing protein n=1 Tax=Ktedonospora formicarum TaxID=2778364 RepID=A0A8J3IA86_9CHLR|nr:cold shock domain-containing protein [Ktedonospora formicarum]GHO49635.1 hypothetical protein KSX_77980 [Ktedonospora formicarum]